MSEVVRLEGKLDGTGIIFTRELGGQPWTAQVPKDLTDGVYILEVTAYDEAGNTAYSTAMLFTVNLENLTVNILPLKFNARTLDGKYEAGPLKNKFVAVVLKREYAAAEMPQKYTYRAVSA